MSKLVVLDPGHYKGYNPYPPYPGFYEGEQMFKLAYMIQPLLVASGITVKVTRAKVEDNPSLEERGKLAGVNKADLFISLHSDAVSNTSTDSARGVSCFYSIQDSARNKPIAEKLASSVAAYIGTKNRGALTRIGNGGLDYYGVIRASANYGCKCAFLIEHGFHSSPSDCKYLVTDPSLKEIAKIDAKCICEALGVTYKGEAAVESVTPTPPTTTTPSANTTSTYKLVTSVKKYTSAANAMSGTNSVGTLAAGTYYIYKQASGSYNLTKTKGVAGAWINPADNKVTTTAPAQPSSSTLKVGTVIQFKSGTTPYYGGSAVGTKVPTSVIGKINRAKTTKITSIKKLNNVDCALLDTINSWVPTKYLEPAKKVTTPPTTSTPSTGTVNTYKLVTSVKKYTSAANAMSGTNSVGTLAAGTYYIYKQASGSYNLTKTKGVAGAWINPADNKVTTTTPTQPSSSYSNEEICGSIKLTKDKAIALIKKNSPNFADTEAVVNAFWTIAPKYGIRGDVAICQSIVETGWFKFTGGTAVTPDQHNYCGMGVTSLGVKGNSFATVEAGVEAQIQHLYAYATTKSIPAGRTLYDPRFKYVTRGTATKWIDLEGKWCAKTGTYAKTIFSIYDQMSK